MDLENWLVVLGSKEFTVDCGHAQIEHSKKRRTVSGSDLNGVLTRAPSLVNPERNMVAAFYLASLLCASYVPAAPRGAPLRAASRVAAPMMMPIGVPKVAYRVQPRDSGPAALARGAHGQRL
jgi:hypothetical protein